MNKFKINNISKKTLVYLIFFSVSILLLLWTVQNVFLRIFYEKYQMKYLVNLAKEVHNFDNKANIFNQLEELLSYVKKVGVEKAITMLKEESQK